MKGLLLWEALKLLHIPLIAVFSAVSAFIYFAVWVILLVGNAHY